MTSNAFDPGGDGPRLIVRSPDDVEPRASRGDLVVRPVFTEGGMPFASSFTMALYNRLPAGGANERHVHDDVEKIYYFVSGRGEVECGDWRAGVGAGDFLFFPAAIEHEIHCVGDEDLEFVVCGARTLERPRCAGASGSA